MLLPNKSLFRSATECKYLKVGKMLCVLGFSGYIGMGCGHAADPEITGSNAEKHSIGLRSNGQVIAWGNQQNGRLGDGVTTNTTSGPVQMGKLPAGSPWAVYMTNAVGVSTGSEHSLVVDSYGYAWVCGENSHGQLGDNTFVDKSYLVQVVKSTTSGDYLTNVVQVAGGDRFSEAVDSSGLVWAWGWQADGRLGNGTATGNQRYAEVVQKDTGGNLTGIDKIAVGHSHTLALDDDIDGGIVWVWGDNTSAKIGYHPVLPGGGNATRLETASRLAQTVGVPLNGVADVSAGYLHSVILKSDGSVWTCGEQLDGRLGNGATTTASMAGTVQVQAISTAGDPLVENPSSTLTNIVMVAAGPNHTLALKAGGTVWVWGVNNEGQLGDGTLTNRSKAVKVPGLTDIVWVGAGGLDDDSNTSFALKSDGTLYAWGSNSNKELADGTTTNRSSPVVSTATGF